MPKEKKGGQVRNKITYIPDGEKKCLTEDQARYIYEKIEQNRSVNIHAMKQEIEDDKMSRNTQEEEESEVNPYQLAILNIRPKEDAKIEQMINWLIFSDRIIYMDRSSCSVNPSLTIRALDDKKHKRLYNSLKTEEELIPDIIFDENRIRNTYLDKYDGIQTQISQANSFDESTDLSTTYFGRTDVTGEQAIKAEERFPISGQGYTDGKLLDQTDCSILKDTGASKSYMSKLYYM